MNIQKKAMPKVRKDIEALGASMIREIADAAIGQKDIIPLWFGESDRMTSSLITSAAQAALGGGETFYAPNLGIPKLRQAIAEYLTGLHLRAVSQDRVVVTASGMNGLALAAQALIEAADEVIVLTPSWPNLTAVWDIQGARTISFPLAVVEGEWRLDLERLLATITENTRAVVINSPSNPSGWAMTADEQRALLLHCRQTGTWIVSDEVYGRIWYGAGQVAPSFLDVAEADDRVIVVNSFSKTWDMTGWRLGWLVVPDGMSPEFAKLNEYNVASATTFVQHAGVTAIREGEGDILLKRVDYQGNLRMVARALARLPIIDFPEPRGAFYAFFHVKGVDDSVLAAKQLLSKTGVGLAPGRAFGEGSEGWFRLCFAIDEKRLDVALGRLIEEMPKLTSAAMSHRA